MAVYASTKYDGLEWTVRALWADVVRLSFIFVVLVGGSAAVVIAGVRYVPADAYRHNVPALAVMGVTAAAVLVVAIALAARVMTYLRRIDVLRRDA